MTWIKLGKTKIKPKGNQMPSANILIMMIILHGENNNYEDQHMVNGVYMKCLFIVILQGKNTDVR